MALIVSFMPNTLHEKALAQPFRVGLMLGALTLPTLWTLSQDLWNKVLGQGLLNSEEITQLFAIGFVPGMILGAGALRAWVAWKEKDFGEARGLLLGHGGFTFLLCAITLLPLTRDVYQAATTQGWEVLLSQNAVWLYTNIPLQVALAMLLVGLFMRGENA